MTHSSKTLKVAALVALGLLAGRSDAATFATFDAQQFRANGFAYNDFNEFSAIDATGASILLDIANDLDGVNGIFGGMGSDISADFNAATTQLEVTLTVDPLNAATDFRVVLVDNDGVGIGEEYQFFVDLTGVTPGQPVTLTQSLSNPGPVFRQAAFNQIDGDMSQNYGLRQVQIQSAFGATNRLKIALDSVKLVDPGDPLLIEFNAASYQAQPQRFTFGTFAETGAVDVTGPNILINADAAAASGPNGGFGFNGLNVDFDAADYQIEVVAKLLPGNTATGFNLLLGDNDGNDSGPGLGSEDYIFEVNTSEFSTTGFTTFTLPLGSGSESSIVRTFAFNNDGDGLQNFDLSQMQIQSLDAGTGVLAIEIERFSIVERSASLPGDANGDGAVNLLDLDILGANFGAASGATVSQGDFNADGAVNLLDLDILGANFGTGGATAVPEPAALAVALGSLVAVAAGRRPRR